MEDELKDDKKSNQIDEKDFELDDMMDESFIIDYDIKADPYDPDLFDDDINCDDF